MKKTLIVMLALWSWATFVSAAPVDINLADAKTLAVELRGVGAERAQAIVQYRKEHGPFRTIDELVKVKGIGKKTLEANRSNLILNSAR